jgi:hypothetical protein
MARLNKVEGWSSAFRLRDKTRTAIVRRRSTVDCRADLKVRTTPNKKAVIFSTTAFLETVVYLSPLDMPVTHVSW